MDRGASAPLTGDIGTKVVPVSTLPEDSTSIAGGGVGVGAGTGAGALGGATFGLTTGFGLNTAGLTGFGFGWTTTTGGS